MLGLFFIYFIGRAYYYLAEEHHKNKWLFAIMGILSYYGGSFIGGVIAYLAYDMMNVNGVSFNEAILTVIGIFLGLLTCWVYYSLLKRNWKNKVFGEDATILDDDFLNEDFLNDNIDKEDNWK